MPFPLKLTSLPCLFACTGGSEAKTVQPGCENTTCKEASTNHREEQEVIGISNDSAHETSGSENLGTEQGTSDCSSSGPEGNNNNPSSAQTEAAWVTMKVTCDQDTVRFKFTTREKSGIQELRDEVNRRLNMAAGMMFDLKYLDDDDEWMLLTCDADLQECLDVMRASRRNAIKLMVRCKALASDACKLHWK